MRRKSWKLFIILLVLAVAIGYAALSTTLKINGTSGIKRNTWYVHWANVGDVVKTENVTIREAAAVDESDDTIVNFNALFTVPGDYYEFQVDAVNEGTLDAMADIVSVIVNDDEDEALPSYLTYTIKYADDTPFEKNDLLRKAKNGTPSSLRLKIRISLGDLTAEEMALIPEEGVNYSLSIQIPYKQADEHAVPKGFVPTDFEIGDYFLYTTPNGNYTLPTSVTAASEERILHLADLKLWRVIDIHDNGEVEAVSNYTAGTQPGGGISFGVTNYQEPQSLGTYENYVQVLRDAANGLVDNSYVSKARPVGDDGQTGVVSSSSAFDGTSSGCPSTTSTPSTMSVDPLEYDGGIYGDTLYIKDLKLIKNVYNKASACSAGINDVTAHGCNTNSKYWLASRYYVYVNGMAKCGFGGRVVTIDNTLYGEWLRGYTSNNGWGNYAPSAYFRAIITLKPRVGITSGSGTGDDPYVINNTNVTD